MQTTSETNVSLNAPFTIQRFFLSTSEWHKLHYELSTYPWSTQLWGGLGLHKITVFYLVVLIKTEKLKLHSWRFVGTASRNVWYNLICKFQTKQFESGSWKIMFPLTFSLLFNSFLLHNIPYTEKKLPKPLGLDPKCISDLDSGPSKTVVNAVPLQRTSNVKKMTSSYIKQALF